MLLTIPFLWSCSAEEPIISEPDVPIVEDQNFVPLDDALKIADKHFALVYGNETRSSRNVENVEFFNRTTRSGDDDDHGFYVVNYENNGGFALLSADNRRGAVYAISDNGAMHLNDTIDNEGLNWYLNKVLTDPDGVASIKRNKGIFPPPGNPFDTTLHDFIDLGPERIELCKPLLPDAITQFSQMEPYNKYCPKIGGIQSYVGSAPLCTGTIMAYYKWPTSVAGIDYNWDEMYANPLHDKWPRFFEMLGRSYFMNACYETILSFTHLEDVVKTFNGIIGYKNTVVEDYDYSTLCNQLKNRRPVIVAHDDLKYSQDPMIVKYFSGTCYTTWIIDGGYTLVYKDKKDNNRIVNVESVFNCIWGAGGKENGYFLLHNDYFTNTPSLPEPRNKCTRHINKIIYGFEIK